MEDFMKDFYKIFKDSYVQCFDDSGQARKEMVRVFPMSQMESQMDIIKELNKMGAGIFFTPNPCKNGRREANVTKIDWIYVDMDTGTKEEMQAKIKSAPIKPTMIVEASRSYHLYWRVDCNKPEFDQMIPGLIEFFDGDKAISSINEVLRIPGFYHMKKPEKPFLVKLIYFNKKQLSSPFKASEILSGYGYTQKDIPSKLGPSEGQILPIGGGGIYSDIKNIPIMDVLYSLGVDVRSGCIVEEGQITSARVNVSGNYINRFSGKEGSGSTVDACMVYGKMSLREAINYLEDKWNVEKDIKQVMKETEIEIDDIDKENKPFTWGTHVLDTKISPMSNDSFVIFAGETGVGKTAWAFDMAEKNAKEGHKVLFLSLEMNTNSILTRIAREYARITKEQWRVKSTITDHQRERYKHRKEELKNNKNLIPLGFSGPTHPTIDNIRGLVEKIKPDIVFVDNFDLITKETSSAMSETGSESRLALKLLKICKDMPVPMVLLHHLNKGKDEDSSKLRGINSIRGSSKITHDADIVLIGFRPPYKEGQTDEDRAKFTIAQIKDRDFGVGGQHIIYFADGTFKDTYSQATVRRMVEEAESVFGI